MALYTAALFPALILLVTGLQNTGIPDAYQTIVLVLVGVVVMNPIGKWLALDEGSDRTALDDHLQAMKEDMPEIDEIIRKHYEEIAKANSSPQPKAPHHQP